jgi:transcriptional regulator with XRE-family HTH domain
MANLHKINDLRKDRNYSWQDISDKLGISLAGVQKIIASNSTKIETLEKIAEFFEVPVRYFFEDIEINDLNTGQFKERITELQRTIDLYSGLIDNTSETFKTIWLLSQFIPGFEMPDNLRENHENPIKFVSDFNNYVKDKSDKWIEAINKDIKESQRIKEEIKKKPKINRFLTPFARLLGLDK